MKQMQILIQLYTVQVRRKQGVNKKIITNSKIRKLKIYAKIVIQII